MPAIDAHFELSKSLITRWQATSSLSGISGPFRNAAQPANLRTFPFAVFGTYIDRFDLIATTPTTEVREHEFDLRIYDRTPEQCGQHAANLRDAFNTFTDPQTAFALPAGLTCDKVRIGNGRNGKSAARDEHFVEWILMFSTSQSRA